MPIAGAGAGLHGWHLSEFRALGGIDGRMFNMLIAGMVARVLLIDGVMEAALPF